MERVYINDLKLGSRVALNISAHGRTIVTKGTVVTKNIITILKLNSVISVPIQSTDDRVDEIKEELMTYDEPFSSKLDKIAKTEEYKRFAKDYIQKSIEVKQAFNDVKNGDLEGAKKLSEDTLEFIKQNTNNSMLDFLSILRNRDYSLYEHSLNVAALTSLFAGWLNLNETETTEVTLVGLFHDIGKISFSEEMIKNEYRLPADRELEIQMHPLYGFKFLKNSDLPENVKRGILEHHEYVNKEGYPRQLGMNEISPYAQIVGIVEEYDTAITRIPYKHTKTPFEAIKELEDTWFEKYNGQYAMTFIDRIAQSYLDSFVKLSNGAIGKVTFVNNNNKSRPIIKLEDNTFIDLSERKDLQIIEVF